MAKKVKKSFRQSRKLGLFTPDFIKGLAVGILIAGLLKYYFALIYGN